MKRILYIILLAVFVSCGKEGGPSGRLMEFFVRTPDVVGTKAEVTSENLTSRNVYVYGIKSDGTTSNPVFERSYSVPLTYNGTNGIWNPNQGGQVFIWDAQGKTYYQFYAYTYDQGDAELSISNTEYGRQFTVTQPEAGDGSNTADYLLSYMVNVAPSANYPMVNLNLEHAMAKVEVDVQIANSMFDDLTTDQVNGEVCLAENINVTVSGINRKAAMLCVQPKLDGEEGTNTWQVTLDETYKASYEKGISAEKSQNMVGENSLAPDMEFMAVPVTNAQMTGYKLVLKYDGVVSKNQYEYTFDLAEFTPKGWVSGHKIRYVLTIDNSISLTGSVVDYEDVDYIEAVIVPSQPADNQNQ